MEKLDEEENAYAKELRAYCSHYGVEKKEYLDKTGTLLWKMAMVYLKKTSIASNMQRKLSFIRCAVLLYAARARFRITHNSSKEDELLDTIRDFENKLRQACCCVHGLPLHEMSRRISERAIQLRLNAKSMLSRDVVRNHPEKDKASFLEKTKDLLTVEELTIEETSSRSLNRDEMEDEEKVISGMRSFMEKFTTEYKSLMCEIATECLAMLPGPPCKFCIVGLGSFARGEVTLYSDFEHFILLEAGADKLDNYNQIAEYFRWYSVLFQVVVVGMGETIIPSVTIRSLNDAYSGDSSRNWFYDKYTPRGISFDGMLPHSCNIPLGRQQTTANRKHIVELIQTPKNMARFVTCEECEKNGYYLGEVLRDTRFVYGDAGTYITFLAERDNILTLEGAFSGEKYQKFVLNNSNANLRGIPHLSDITTFDSKNVFYRPVVTLLTFLGQIHNAVSTSTFDLLDRLLQLDIIEKELHQDLSYALAVACEMRWKLYLLADEQRHSAEIDNVIDSIGENAVHACRSVLTKLRNLVSREEVGEKEDDRGHEIINSISGRGNFDEAIQFGEKMLAQLTKQGEDCMFYKIKVLCECYKAGCLDASKRTECWNRAEDLYVNHICGSDLSYADAIEIFLRMSVMYHTQGRIEDSLAESRKYFEANNMMLQISGEIHQEFAPNFQQYHELVFHQMSATDAEKHLSEVLWNDKSIQYSVDCQFTVRYYKALLMMLQDKGDGFALAQAKEEFRKLANDAREKASKLQQPRRFLITVMFRQISKFWLKDAIRSIEYIEQNPAPPHSQYEFALVQESCIDIIKFQCHCRLGMYREALAWAESGVKISSSHSDQILLLRLLRGLVSKLWRTLTDERITYGKKEVTLILLYVLRFALSGHESDIFSCPRPLGSAKSVQHTIILLKKYYGDNYGMLTVQAVQNIYCVIFLMLAGFEQFYAP